MPLDSAWDSYRARCDRCLTVLSEWYPERRFALDAAERHGAMVREVAGLIVYCAACKAQIGGLWLDSLSRPKEMVDG